MNFPKVDYGPPTFGPVVTVIMLPVAALVAGVTALVDRLGRNGK